MAIGYRQGKTTVIVSDDIERAFRRALAQVAPTVLPAIEEAVERVKDDAYDLWPVRTGASRDGLDTETRVYRDRVAGIISDSEPYTYKIKFSTNTDRPTEAQEKASRRRWGHGVPYTTRPELAGKHVWTVLVRNRVRDAAKEVARKVGPEIRDLIAGQV